MEDVIVDAVSVLKDQVIHDFIMLLNRAGNGYQDDYQYILNKILFIDTREHLENRDAIFEYLINS